MFPMASWERGRPARSTPTWRPRYRGSPSARPLRFPPTWWLPAKSWKLSDPTGCGRDARAPRECPITPPLRGSRRSRAARRRLMRWGVDAGPPGAARGHAKPLQHRPDTHCLPKNPPLGSASADRDRFRRTSGCRRPSPSYSARECGLACGRLHGRPPAPARPSSRSVPSSPSRAKRGFPETSFGPRPHWSS